MTVKPEIQILGRILEQRTATLKPLTHEAASAFTPLLLNEAKTLYTKPVWEEGDLRQLAHLWFERGRAFHWGWVPTENTPSHKVVVLKPLGKILKEGIQELLVYTLEEHLPRVILDPKALNESLVKWFHLGRACEGLQEQGYLEVLLALPGIATGL